MELPLGKLCTHKRGRAVFHLSSVSLFWLSPCVPPGWKRSGLPQLSVILKPKDQRWWGVEDQRTDRKKREMRGVKTKGLMWGWDIKSKEKRRINRERWGAGSVRTERWSEMESFLELRCVALKKADANSTQLNVFLIEAEEEKKRRGVFKQRICSINSSGSTCQISNDEYVRLDFTRGDVCKWRTETCKSNTGGYSRWLWGCKRDVLVLQSCVKETVTVTFLLLQQQHHSSSEAFRNTGKRIKWSHLSVYEYN